MSDTKNICELVREAETNYTGQVTSSKYVTENFSDDINKIYAYLASKHTTGEKDSLGRDKPFFNIVIAARNIWFRSTDIDRKNINIKPTKAADVVAAFVATIFLQDWMRRENFGQFLNDWGLELAGFNSAIVKFIDTNNKLHPVVVPWSRMICDSIDFANNPKIEILELTEAQLYQREGYDKDIVEKLCDALSARETIDKTRIDNKNNYIKLYEIHGNLPLSYLTGEDKDEDVYVQQMHVVSFIASKEEGKFDDFTLYSGKEEKDPYMLTSLIPATDGSISLNGAVKNLFEAQWMTNHTAKNIKDQLDLAKSIFQTSDPRFTNQNVLTAIENGDILFHFVNQPVTRLDMGVHDITAHQNHGIMWKNIANEIAGISESMLGNTAPSGTPWRQIEALLQESHSLFELMTENKGLDVEQMLRLYVIPFIKKQVANSKELAATLEDRDVRKLDAMYIPREAVRRYNKKAKEDILNGVIPSPYNQQQAEGEIQQNLAPLGNQRFLKPSDISNKQWKDIFKDLEWDVECDITNEAVDKDAVTTLNTLLMTIGKNPQIMQDPAMRMIVNKILMQTNVVSPLELAATPSVPIAPQVNNANAVGGELKT